jgi:hypothetical protein
MCCGNPKYDAETAERQYENLQKPRLNILGDGRINSNP